MTLDVIIPAYNAHDTIDEAIASVAMQKIDKGDSVHIIIVNDASPDGSYHECAQYWAALGLNIGVVDRKENGGCGQARQSGIDVGTGDAIMFLDADDVLGSPFALRVFFDAMKLDYDIVMGQFVEEQADHSVLVHGANWIWMHGKCYSRKFIEASGLRFNETRANEDVGYNAVLQNLTEHVLYVPQTVYIWQCNEDSTVRKDHGAYTFGHGWRGFIRNMAWAEEELAKRNVPPEKIVDFLSMVTARIYWQTMDGHEQRPEEEEENWPAMQKLYKETIHPYIESGQLTDEKLREGYFKVAGETPMASIPFITFEQFLDRLRG